MRILVTRPQPAAAATAARLEALGHEPILLPLTQAIHIPEAATAALAAPHAAIAVTSAEAIRTLARQRGHLAPHLQTPVFSVGAATARAATELGFQSVIAGPGTGSGLAKLVAEAYASNGLSGPLLYLAGLPRSPAFESALREAGIPCRVAEIYRMTAITPTPEEIKDLLEARRPDVALFYSHESARHFFRVVAEEKTAAFRLLCLSDHVAAAMPQGFSNIAVAAEPTEDSLLALL